MSARASSSTSSATFSSFSGSFPPVARAPCRPRARLLEAVEELALRFVGDFLKKEVIMMTVRRRESQTLVRECSTWCRDHYGGNKAKVFVRCCGVDVGSAASRVRKPQKTNGGRVATSRAFAHGHEKMMRKSKLIW